MTCRLHSTSDIQGKFATEAPLVLGFTPRQALQQLLEERSSGRLHLDTEVGKVAHVAQALSDLDGVQLFQGPALLHCAKPRAC